VKKDPSPEFQLRPRPFDDFAWAFGLIRSTKRILNFLHHELRSPLRLPWSETWRAWSHGFGRVSYRAYSLAHRDSGLYVPPFTQVTRGHHINGVYDIVINNKAIHHLLMKAADLPCPGHLGLVQEDGIQLPDGHYVSLSASSLEELAENRPGIVIRPVKGMKGLGLLFVQSSAVGLTANQEPIPADKLTQLVGRLAPAVITERLLPSQYSRNLYPRTVNTIRFLTLWDYDRGEPFVAAATQRIGTSRSYPADNFQGGLGGFSADIPLETGMTGRARGLDRNYQVLESDTHPETGAQIRGLSVPKWDEMTKAFISGARTFHTAPMLAWDVATTEDGFSVIEVNGTPGLLVHQIHRPLLADPRVRNFYRHHRLIR